MAGRQDLDQLTPEVTASITAENTFTDWLAFGGRGQESAQLAISGSFTATVTVQYRRRGGAAIDLEQYTAPAVRIVDIVGTGDLRVGVKTGDFGSGTVAVSLHK